MTLHKHVNGDIIDADETNEDNVEAYTMIGLNTIRGLIDRSGVWSAGMIDGWGEAYVDADGREGSVSAVLALFDTNSYYCRPDDEASGDTTNDDDSFTNPSYAFDSDDSTQASKTVTNNTSFDVALGKTFGAKTVNDVLIISRYNTDGHSAGTTDVKLQTYNGSTWSDDTTLYTVTGGGSDSGIKINFVNIDSSIQGVRVRFEETSAAGSSTSTCSIYSLEYGSGGNDTSTITHDIPSGTFSSTISSAFGTALIADWETGADIQYKLTGTSGTEDTGWLDYNTISNFTAFTAEPDTLIVKLIPKTTSPTAGYPSIRGFWIRAV